MLRKCRFFAADYAPNLCIPQVARELHMNIYSELLFLHGHVAQPDLAHSLAGEPMPSSQDPQPGRGPGQRGTAPAVCRSGAVAVVCGATALSPFR